MERVEALVRESEKLDEALLMNHAVAAPDRLRLRERDLMLALARGPHDAVTQTADERLAERKALHDAARDLFASLRSTPTPDA